MLRGENAHDDIPNRPSEEHRRYRIFMHTGADVVVSEEIQGAKFGTAQFAPWVHIGDVLLGPDDADPLFVGMARIALEKWARMFGFSLAKGQRFWLMDDETDGDVFAVTVGVSEDRAAELERR